MDYFAMNDECNRDHAEIILHKDDGHVGGYGHTDGWMFGQWFG